MSKTISKQAVCTGFSLHLIHVHEDLVLDKDLSHFQTTRGLTYGWENADHIFIALLWFPINFRPIDLTLSLRMSWSPPAFSYTGGNE